MTWLPCGDKVTSAAQVPEPRLWKFVHRSPYLSQSAVFHTSLTDLSNQEAWGVLPCLPTWGGIEVG